MAIQDKTKEELKKELQKLLQENNFLRVENEKREAELIIANKKLLTQNKEKRKRADEFITANIELDFQNEEKKKRAAELIIANIELAFQKVEKGKRAKELIIANRELAFQKVEKGKRAKELIIANRELAFQKVEKGKRAKELIIANRELGFQEGEKEKRADELIVAKIKIVLKEEENEKIAAELIIANLALGLQEELIEAKEKTEESEIRFQNLFDNSPISKSITGIDGSLMVNNKFCDTLGYSKEELETVTWQELTFPEDKEKSNKIIQSLLQGPNKLARFEKRYVHKNGDVIYADISTFLQRDNDNNPKYFITAFNDITKQKQNEQKLLRSDRVFNLTLDMFCIAGFDGYFKYLNPAWEKTLGWSIEDLLSKPWLDFVHPDDAENTENIKSTIVDGKIVYKFENRYICKDGSIRWLSWTSQPFPEENIMIGAARDITEAKRIENELIQAKERAEVSEKNLKLSNAHLTSSIEMMPTGYILWDNNLNVLEWNRAAETIFGYSRKEIIGKNPIDFIVPKEARLLVAEVLKKLKQGEISDYSAKNNNIHKNGTLISCRWFNTPLIDLKGNVFAILTIALDITKQFQVEEKLIEAKEQAEQSDKLKSAFLANMSHEIRTPMNGILGFSELLKTPHLSDEEQQKYIRVIEKSGNRMLNIINDIVDISKIEAGLIDVNFNESNINEQIEYIYTFFKPEVEGKGMQLFFKNGLPKKQATINTDREKVFSILTNLVKNAIKYSNEGSIEIGYVLKTVGAVREQSRKTELEFFIKDTGIGVPKDRQGVIFERFIQADILDKMARQGAGLGLSITKAYVEMLGGQIWLESEEGVGSTFYFTLPYTLELEVKNSIKNIEVAYDMVNQVKNLKILIAEDDEISSELLSTIVSDISNKILKATNGNEAIEICRNNPDIDVILMDIQMPERNGYEATRQIRHFNKKVIIIAQTAFGLTGDREKSLDAGCNDYITKPINKDHLLDLIQKYFKK